MSEKHGLCIGGPLAGCRATCQSDILKAAIPQKVSPIYIDAAVPSWDEIGHSIFVYKHFDMRFSDGGEIKTANFWIDADEKQPFNAVMSALVKCYEDNASPIPLTHGERE